MSDQSETDPSKLEDRSADKQKAADRKTHGRQTRALFTGCYHLFAVMWCKLPQRNNEHTSHGEEEQD